MESVMAEVAPLNLVEQHITAAIKNTTDFEWIGCTGCSLDHQQTVGGVVIIYIPWWCKQTNWLMTETARQMATKRKMKNLAHQ
jgi:hypothetical protein